MWRPAMPVTGSGSSFAWPNATRPQGFSEGSHQVPCPHENLGPACDTHRWNIGPLGPVSRPWALHNSVLLEKTKSQNPNRLFRCVKPGFHRHPVASRSGSATYVLPIGRKNIANIPQPQRAGIHLDKKPFLLVILAPFYVERGENPWTGSGGLYSSFETSAHAPAMRIHEDIR